MLQKTEEKPHQICILEGNKWICDIFSFAVVFLSTDVGLTLTVTGVPKSFPELAKHRDGIKSVEKSDRCGKVRQVWKSQTGVEIESETFHQQSIM